MSQRAPDTGKPLPEEIDGASNQDVGSSEAPKETSELRRARIHRNWTLDDVVAAIQKRSPSGSSGVTTSLVSSWERGKVRTSPRYRKICCEIFGLSSEILFAHQDAETIPTGDHPVRPRTDWRLPRILRPQDEPLTPRMIRIAREAERYLVTTGSRSRAMDYLQAIEETLRLKPGLIHYRILYGEPHHHALKEHLLHLLTIRPSIERSTAQKTLHIGIVSNTVASAERFFCASEREAIILIPSFTSSENFDTGVIVGPDDAASLLKHGREAYGGSRPIETPEAIENLLVLRP